MADPPVKRTVERSGEAVAEGNEDGCEEEGDGGEGDGDEGDFGGAEPEGCADDAARALRTAASSNGRLCAAPPSPSELASCHAPNAPAAVPTATHAAVTTAFRHFLIPPLCRIVS
ncbi:hypothetical protein ACFVYR_28605 [Streptomyces sp. NPDC058284]|uniref:hypothetical protein n=1 Tax=unclassified Streptomyces TaxID=2593676 RepID=UPI00365A908B